MSSSPTPAPAAFAPPALLARANPKAASALALSLLQSENPVWRAHGAALAEPCLAKSFAARAPDIAGLRLFAALLGQLDNDGSNRLLAGREAQVMASLSRLTPLLDSKGIERLGGAFPQAFEKMQPATIATSPLALRWIDQQGRLSDELLERLCSEFALDYPRSASSETQSPAREGWEWLCSERSERLEAFFTAAANAPQSASAHSFILSHYTAPLYCGPGAAIAGRAFAQSPLPQNPQFLSQFLAWMRQPGAEDFAGAFCKTLFERQKSDPAFAAASNLAFCAGALTLAFSYDQALRLMAPKTRQNAMAASIFVAPSGWRDLPIILAAQDLPRQGSSQAPSPFNTLATARKIIAVLRALGEADPTASLPLHLTQPGTNAYGEPHGSRDYGHLAAHVALLALAPGLQPSDLTESAGRRPVIEALSQDAIARMRLSGELALHARALAEAATLNAIALTSGAKTKARAPSAPSKPATRL